MDRETLNAAIGLFVIGPLYGLAMWAILYTLYKLATT